MSAAMSLSIRMARFAHEMSLDAVPAPVLRLARLHLADAIGVGLAAARVPAHQRLLTQLRAEGAGAAEGPATVIGFAGGVPAPLAAMLNGTSIHSLEYDDTHMASIVHGSAVIVPAAILPATTELAASALVVIVPSAIMSPMKAIFAVPLTV